MAAEGYHTRQRSKWVEEAIDHLMSMEAYEELVAEDFIRRGGNVNLSLTVHEPMRKSLDRAISHVQKTLDLDDALSRIIRTAIIQRLIVREHNLADAG